MLIVSNISERGGVWLRETTDTLAVSLKKKNRMNRHETASLILGSWNRSNTSGGEARLDPEERIKQSIIISCL